MSLQSRRITPSGNPPYALSPAARTPQPSQARQFRRLVGGRRDRAGAGEHRRSDHAVGIPLRIVGTGIQQQGQGGLAEDVIRQFIRESSAGYAPLARPTHCYTHDERVFPPPDQASERQHDPNRRKPTGIRITRGTTAPVARICGAHITQGFLLTLFAR